MSGFKLPGNPNASKEAALAAARAKAAPKEQSDAPIIKYINPEDCPDKNRILADDSGSMTGQFENAKKGMVEYCRNCIPNQTAVAVHFFNGQEQPEEAYSWNKETNEKYKNLSQLQSNLVLLANYVDAAPFNGGGTPFFGACMRVLSLSPFCNRLIVFSDGSPTDSLNPGQRNYEEVFDHYSANVVCSKAIEHKCVVDTVFFGENYKSRGEDCGEVQLMKYIAEKTGGIFLHFDPSKVNFATAFKYLAPVNRMMLASESFRAEVESGKRS